MNNREKEASLFIKNRQKEVGFRLMLDSVKIVQTLLDNISNNPEQEKYRFINPEKQKIKSTLFAHPQIKKLLIILGYQTTPDGKMILPDQNFSQAMQSIKQIKYARMQMQARYQQPFQYKKTLQKIQYLRANDKLIKNKFSDKKKISQKLFMERRQRENYNQDRLFSGQAVQINFGSSSPNPCTQSSG